MIRISNIKLPLDYNMRTLRKIVCKTLRIEPEAIEKLTMLRRSIDARRKNNIHFIATLDVDVVLDEASVIAKSRDKNVVIAEPYRYELPIPKKDFSNRPIVVGTGPAGLFAGLILAQAGVKPILIERGKSLEKRTEDVEAFFHDGVLSSESNIQFGEGGAGTFSDGKLNTGTKDSRSRKVLLEFAKAGAPKEILYNAKPHIGTDRLVEAVKNIRNEIIALGGTVMFETRLEGFKIRDGQIKGAVVERHGIWEILDTENIILAIGHSARDTFNMLLDYPIPMAQKSFSIGVRIEHLRKMIDISQYASFAGHSRLGAADYKMAVHLDSGRSVYTFCMCPGGTVVGAASEPFSLVTNGMSNFARDGVNSNSALLVGVKPEDFGSDHVLAGIDFQRLIEHQAFMLGGENYCAPVQRVGDFLKQQPSSNLGEILPTYQPGYTLSNLWEILPDYVSQSIASALPVMNERLEGFSSDDAILTGVETRSSSPVRIIRDSSYQSVGVKGLYPCGEGSGYAGGIVSAAVDGIKCAEAVIIN